MGWICLQCGWIDEQMLPRKCPYCGRSKIRGNFTIKGEKNEITNC